MEELFLKNFLIICITYHYGITHLKKYISIFSSYTLKMQRSIIINEVIVTDRKKSNG